MVLVLKMYTTSLLCCPQFISSFKISKWLRQLQDRWWFLRRWWHWRVGGCWSWWHWGRWQTRGWRNLIRLIGVIIKIPSTWDQKLTGLGGAGTIAGGGGLATALPPLGSESLKLNCRKNSLVSLRRKRRNVLRKATAYLFQWDQKRCSDLSTSREGTFDLRKWKHYFELTMPHYFALVKRVHLECNGLIGLSRKQEILPLSVRGLNLDFAAWVTGAQT